MNKTDLLAFGFLASIIGFATSAIAALLEGKANGIKAWDTWAAWGQVAAVVGLVCAIAAELFGK